VVHPVADADAAGVVELLHPIVGLVADGVQIVVPHGVLLDSMTPALLPVSQDFR
jgi:hypothetical protein